MPDDARILRDRLTSLGGSIDNAKGGADAVGNAAFLGQTTKVSSYPTNASAFYAVIPCDADGAETEGGSASYVPRTGTIVYALNIGSAVPPQGTMIVVHVVGGRNVFRYDG